jgi:DNA-binding PucR family transcriptional regulator
MNVTQLQSIFPSLIKSDSNVISAREEYDWFETKDGETIGIKKSELTSNESILLHSFLKKAHLQSHILSERAKVWHDLLLENRQVEQMELDSYRFLFFQLSTQDKSSIDLFNEGIQAIFPFAMPIIWFSGLDGVIIEEIRSSKQQPVQVDEMADIIMSDLYLKVRFFVGELLKDLNQAHEHFVWVKEIAQSTLLSSKKTVSHLKNRLPSVLVQQLDAKEQKIIISTFFNQVKDDQEILKTIQTYLESNLNVTKAAKKLYMHRNSLQYRIDKFIELTGIDIKTFQGAMTAYLILLMIQDC